MLFKYGIYFLASLQGYFLISFLLSCIFFLEIKKYKLHLLFLLKTKTFGLFFNFLLLFKLFYMFDSVW